MRDAHAFPRFSICTVIGAFLAAALMQAACGSSGNTFTAPSALSKCSVTTEASASNFPAAGGTASITVSTERECQWTAAPDAAWLKVTAGASGQGPGTVQLTASANADPVARAAAVVVNNQRVTIAQDAADCRIDLSARSASFASAGGTGSVDVRASSPLCAWTASSDVAWIALTSGANGKGSAAVTFSVAPTSGSPRSGTLHIAGTSFTVDQSEGCAYAITPATYAAGSDGGSTSVTVNASPGCPWTAASNASWIAVGTQAGSGPGSVGITIAPAAGLTRTGTATVAGQTFTVTQSPGCTFDVTPQALSVASAGGSASVSVTVSAGCAWTATSQASWIAITSGASGNGSGTVSINVAAAGGASRSGTLTVAGRTVTVNQGDACTFALSPASQTVSNAGGTTSVGVTTSDGCAWTAASNASWISIASGAAGAGSGSVQLAVASNADADRTGSVTIAGQTFTILQTGGCTYSVSPASQQIASAGGSGSFVLNAGPTCAWTATSAAAWISVTSAPSGTGTATVQFTVAANNGSARSGTIAIAGQTFTVNQDGGCTVTVSPDTIAAPAAGGSQSVQISTAAECSWTATSNAPWISVSSGASGAGNGTTQLAIAANTGAARTGTVTIATMTVTVNQGSGCTFSISPSSQNISAQGGNGTVTVTTGDGCTWNSVSNVNWITVTSGASGAGNGTVQFTVDVNDKKNPRTGTLTIAGQVFTVNQAEATR